MKNYLPLIIILSFFLLLKLTNIGVRMSDTNIYFYTAYQLIEGKTLYKDIFFTNFPLFPYISQVYFFLTFKQLPIYFLTSSIEASCIAGILYYISLKQTKSLLIATISTSIYLFSFIVLSTSDHQTGVFTASLFAIGSFVFFTRKQYFWTGVFTSLMLLTKAYFLPILMTYLLYFLLKNRKALLLFSLSLTITSFVILLPTLIFSRNEFIYQVFNYSLTRAQGIEKGNILRFFITHDVLFFLLFAASFVFVKKYLFFFIFSLCSLLFIIFYQDIYFLYLNFIIPFLCLFFIYLYKDYLSQLSIQKMVIPTGIVFLLLYNLFTYVTHFRNVQKIPNIEQIVQRINLLNPPLLYGVNDTTPALAYLTNTPLLKGIVDTNENMFRKGYLNAKALTQEAVTQHALLIGHGAEYPQAGIEQPLINEIFDLKTLQKTHCKGEGSFPVLSEGITNRISLISCVE